MNVNSVTGKRGRENQAGGESGTGVGNRPGDEELKEGSAEPAQKRLRTNEAQEFAPQMSSANKGGSTEQEFIHFLNLPEELQAQVIHWIDLKTRCKVAQASSGMARLVHDVCWIEHPLSDKKNEKCIPQYFEACSKWVLNEVFAIDPTKSFHEIRNMHLDESQIKWLEKVGSASARIFSSVVIANYPRPLLSAICRSREWHFVSIEFSGKEEWNSLCDCLKMLERSRDGQKRKVYWQVCASATEVEQFARSFPVDAADLVQISFCADDDSLASLQKLNDIKSIEEISINEFSLENGSSAAMMEIMALVGKNFPLLSRFVIDVQEQPLVLTADAWKIFNQGHPNLHQLSLSSLDLGLAEGEIDFSLLRARQVSLQDTRAADPGGHLARWLTDVETVESLRIELEDFSEYPSRDGGKADVKELKRRHQTIDFWLRAMAENRHLIKLSLDGYSWFHGLDEEKIRIEFLRLLNSVGINPNLKTLEVAVCEDISTDYLFGENEVLKPVQKALLNELKTLEMRRPDLKLILLPFSESPLCFQQITFSRPRFLSSDSWTVAGPDGPIRIDPHEASKFVWRLPDWGKGAVEEFLRISSMHFSDRLNLLFSPQLPADGPGLTRQTISEAQAI